MCRNLEHKNKLDPCWLSLRVANNLPILVKGIMWVRIQIKSQVVVWVGIVVVVTCGPVNPAVPFVLGMSIFKDLDLQLSVDQILTIWLVGSWLWPASCVAPSAPGLRGPMQGNQEATIASRSGSYTQSSKSFIAPHIIECLSASI